MRWAHAARKTSTKRGSGWGFSVPGQPPPSLRLRPLRQATSPAPESATPPAFRSFLAATQGVPGYSAGRFPVVERHRQASLRYPFACRRGRALRRGGGGDGRGIARPQGVVFKSGRAKFRHWFSVIRQGYVVARCRDAVTRLGRTKIRPRCPVTRQGRANFRLWGAVTRRGGDVF